MSRLRRRQEWQFLAALFQADRTLATVWWTVLVCRGLLPAAFALATGALVGAVQGGRSLGGPLAAAGAVFLPLPVPAPLHPGPPRGPGADGGPDGAPRRQPGQHRPAAVDLDGLHRRGPGRAAQRP